jgi:hypothetical protein
MIELILKTLSVVQVTKDVKVVVKANVSVTPRIELTFTIFGFAIIISFYPKTIAIAIAFPVEIPASPKLKLPDPSVNKACPLVPSDCGILNKPI